MVSYQDSAVNIETRYTVEFVNNKKDWDYICKGIFNHGEPWDRYQSRKYSSLDDAITFYLVHYFSDATYDVRLFEEILLDGKVVRETYFDSSSLGHYIRSNINKAMEDEILKLRDGSRDTQELISKYDAFIEKYNANKTFKEFCESMGDAMNNKEELNMNSNPKKSGLGKYAGVHGVVFKNDVMPAAPARELSARLAEKPATCRWIPMRNLRSASSGMTGSVRLRLKPLKRHGSAL